jgi:DNA (cytosine-5)-methyltransferase 3A
MNVLSLFDGMSCGQQALERAGIKVDKYFASEIDKYAIQVTMANYPNTIQLGSVVNVDGHSLPKIDILIGGSPCQSFSFAGKRKGMSTKDEQEILTLEHYLQLKEEGFEFEGQSYLFWEYMRLLNEVKPKYFLLENVMMGEKWEKVLSKAIGVKPIMINSSLLSAQNRQRLYWTNIGLEPQGLFGYLESIIQQPKDKCILLKDILEEDIDAKYFLSDKMINWLDNHAIKRDVEVKKLDGNQKSSCLTATAQAKQNLSTDYIVHNMMPRSSTTGKGGTGHLSRSDGKTYCLDTGTTNAIEIIGCDFRVDEGLRFRENGKSGTLAARARNDESCGQLVYRKVIQLNDSKESGGQQPYMQNRVYDINGINPALTTLWNGANLINTKKIRRLTPTECERLQTVKDNYTAHVSDSQRYKMLGNGWTVDVIAHILNYIK